MIKLFNPDSSAEPDLVDFLLNQFLEKHPKADLLTLSWFSLFCSQFLTDNKIDEVRAQENQFLIRIRNLPESELFLPRFTGPEKKEFSLHLYRG